MDSPKTFTIKHPKRWLAVIAIAGGAVILGACNSSPQAQDQNASTRS